MLEDSVNGIHEVVGSTPMNSASKKSSQRDSLSAFFMCFSKKCNLSVTRSIFRIMFREPQLLPTLMLKAQMRISPPFCDNLATLLCEIDSFEKAIS